MQLSTQQDTTTRPPTDTEGAALADFRLALLVVLAGATLAMALVGIVR